MKYNRAEYLQRLRTYFKIQRVGVRKDYYLKYPNVNQSPQTLARAGFVYEGDGDTVRCSSCQVRFEDWTVDDCPDALHARVMPQCQFVVIQLKCCLLYTSRCV